MADPLAEELLTDAALVVMDAGVSFLCAVDEEIHKGSGAFVGVDETRERVFTATFRDVTLKGVVGFVASLPWGRGTTGHLVVTDQFDNHNPGADPVQHVYAFPGARPMSTSPRTKENTDA